MEMKYVVPDMAQSFGTLEFAGESEPVFEKDKNNRRVLTRRSYNLYSDVQKGENVASITKTISLPKLLVHGLQRQSLKQTATGQLITSQN